MKPLITLKIGSLREAMQWILRFILLSIIGFLIYKIYPINPFFVTVSGGVLCLLVMLVSEERIEADQDFLVVSNYYCFNLFKKKKVIRIDKMKNVVVAGNLNLKNSLIDIIIPNGGSSVNEIRIVYRDETEVDCFPTLIYLDELKFLESKLKELIIEKNKPNSFSQPIYREN